MKKETKRYMIVEYAGTKQRVFDTKDELDKMIDDIKRYNNRKNSKYICGNISVDEVDGKYCATIHLYTKLSDKNRISDIDNFTKNFTSSELEYYYADKSRMKEGYKPDINIAYFETISESEKQNQKQKQLLVGIKYIPVLYKDDLKYFDKQYRENCIAFHLNELDPGFFIELANEFCQYHFAGKYIEQLYEYANKVEYEPSLKGSLYATALQLYSCLIYERESNGTVTRDDKGQYQISARRQRDFAFFIRNYNAASKKSPLKYNGSTTKMKKEYLMKHREQLLQRDDINVLSLK